MKIAILTWFHYENYGTAVQVSSLYHYLKINGHNVDVIKYYPQPIGTSLPEYSISNITIRLCHSISRRLFRKEKKQSASLFFSEEKSILFKDYINDSISFTKECKSLTDLEDLNQEYDAFICGSDQIWSPNNFNPRFFLDFVSDKNKLIAYSPSIGLPKVKDKYVRKKMTDLISRFHHLSIRESQGAELIKDLTGMDANTVLDPTLLLSRTDFLSLFSNLKSSNENKNEAYLLVYFLGNNENHWKAVYSIAKHRNLTVKIIPVYQQDLFRNGDIALKVGPQEFLQLISSAKYVCTDSFHGVAVSLQCHIQFSVFERFSKKDPINQNSRIYNILEKTGLNSRIIKYNGTYCQDNDIDYSLVDSLLEFERKKSQYYLIESLSSVEHNTSIQKSKHVLTDHSLCCGCGACKSVCPKSAIVISQNENGFYSAHVNDTICVNCGKCVDVCPFNHSERLQIKCENSALFSYKDKSETVLNNSTSGGFAYRLSSLLIDLGYAIAGCAYNAEKRIANHILITKKEELSLLQGSKYLQSFVSDIYDKIDRYNGPVAFFGTPCQISAVKNRFKSRQNILYIDLICHGVPSYHLLNQYYYYLSSKKFISGSNPIPHFRYKPGGWREKQVQIESDNSAYTIDTQDDLFMRFFTIGFLYMPTCYDCQWRNSSEADIRIGDYWGPKFENDFSGVSMVLCFTNKGKEAILRMKQSNLGSFSSQPIEDYLTYQQTENFSSPLFYEALLDKLKENNCDLYKLAEKYLTPFETEISQQSIFTKIKKTFRLMKNYYLLKWHY